MVVVNYSILISDDWLTVNIVRRSTNDTSENETEILTGILLPGCLIIACLVLIIVALIIAIVRMLKKANSRVSPLFNNIHSKYDLDV